jgi:hypothetical protein
MWDLWWTEWHWGRFSPSISVSPANFHSADCSTSIIYHPAITRGWYNRSVSGRRTKWTRSHSTSEKYLRWTVWGENYKDIFELRVKQTAISSTCTPPATNVIKIHPAISETKNVDWRTWRTFPLYGDGLLKALKYGTRNPRVTRSTIELLLLSREGLNNHGNRRTIEDIDS